MVENRFGNRIDPLLLQRHEREAWTARAISRDERLIDPRQLPYRTAYWIVEDGLRVGTLALDTTLGRELQPVSSLYTFPGWRGTGLAFRGLRCIYDAAIDAGLVGVQLDSHWTWPDTVRRYVRRYGMWASSFKRSIVLAWASVFPPHTITFGDRVATFAVEADGRRVDLIEAERDGDVLVWTEHAPMEERTVVTFHARATFAVALALEGWPLIRSRAELDKAPGYDIGGPEVLARKIGIFEAIDREQGFTPRTPRIPGLPYDEIARELSED